MNTKQRRLLVGGDMLALGLVTVIGFISHGTLASAGNRLWATYLPLAAAWLVLAQPLGLFQENSGITLGYLWRLTLTTVFSVPLAVILRSLWLGGSVAPIFAAVMIATSLLGMLVWRFIWELIFRKR